MQVRQQANIPDATCVLTSQTYCCGLPVSPAQTAAAAAAAAHCCYPHLEHQSIAARSPLACTPQSPPQWRWLRMTPAGHRWAGSLQSHTQQTAMLWMGCMRNARMLLSLVLKRMRKQTGQLWKLQCGGAGWLAGTDLCVRPCPRATAAAGTGPPCP